MVDIGIIAKKSIEKGGCVRLDLSISIQFQLQFIAMLESNLETRFFEKTWFLNSLKNPVS
jgi:hypothetical protein